MVEQIEEDETCAIVAIIVFLQASSFRETWAIIVGITGCFTVLQRLGLIVGILVFLTVLERLGLIVGITGCFTVFQRLGLIVGILVFFTFFFFRDLD